MVHNHGTEDGLGLNCPEVMIDGKLKGLCMTGGVTVPLTFQGQVVGTATVHPNGRLEATIDSKDVGKNLHYLFSAGVADRFSIGHNYAPDWELPPCSSNID